MLRLLRSDEIAIGVRLGRAVFYGGLRDRGPAVIVVRFFEVLDSLLLPLHPLLQLSDLREMRKGRGEGEEEKM